MLRLSYAGICVQKLARMRSPLIKHLCTAAVSEVPKQPNARRWGLVEVGASIFLLYGSYQLVSLALDVHPAVEEGVVMLNKSDEVRKRLGDHIRYSIFWDGTSSPASMHATVPVNGSLGSAKAYVQAVLDENKWKVLQCEVHIQQNEQNIMIDALSDKIITAKDIYSRSSNGKTAIGHHFPAQPLK